MSSHQSDSSQKFNFISFARLSKLELRMSRVTIIGGSLLASVPFAVVFVLQGVSGEAYIISYRETVYEFPNILSYFFNESIKAILPPPQRNLFHRRFGYMCGVHVQELTQISINRWFKVHSSGRFFFWYLSFKIDESTN